MSQFLHWLRNLYAYFKQLFTVAGSIIFLGGPAQKMLFFQMVPISFLSVLIHSTRCKYDSLDFFFKNFDWNLPVGRVKVKIVEFWLE